MKFSFLKLFLVLSSTNCMFAMHTGRTRLHDAANHNEIEVAKVLIAAGDNVNARDLYDYTPLHEFAITTFAEEMAIVLIESGADVGAQNRYGHTPLDISIRLMHGNLTRALITTVHPREIQEGLPALIAKKMALAKKYLETSQLDELEQEITQSFERVKSKSPALEHSQFKN